MKTLWSAGMSLALCLGCTGLPAAPSAPYPRIANCYGAHLGQTLTQEQIQRYSRYGLLIGVGWPPEGNDVLNANLLELRRINPQQVQLDFATSAPYEYPTMESFPADGWLMDMSGVRMAAWPGTDMINLTLPSVQQWHVTKCLNALNRKQVHGVFIDSMAPVFDDWACEIATGRRWQVDLNGDGQPDTPRSLDGLWAQSKRAILVKLRAEMPDRPLMINAADRSWRPLLNGILLEDVLEPVLNGEREWEDVLTEYLYWTSGPHRPMLTTIVTPAGIEPPFDPWRLPEAEQKAFLDRGLREQQRMRFGLCTTLMGDGYHAFDLHTRWRGQDWWFPEYDTPLGQPRGAATRRPDGAWERRFTGGHVVVNPGLYGVEVRFDQVMRDQTSGRTARRCVVPPLDGRLYVPAPGAQDAPQADDRRWLFQRPRAAEVREITDGWPMVTRSGLEVRIDRDGSIRGMLKNGAPIAGRVGIDLVTSDAWRNLPVSDLRVSTADKQLTVSAVRREGDMALQSTQTIRPSADGGLQITWRLKALTPVRLYHARLRVVLPQSRWQGRTVRVDSRPVVLPDAIAASALAKGRRVLLDAVQLDSDTVFELTDERYWRGTGYRLYARPFPLEWRSGQTVSAAITLR